MREGPRIQAVDIKHNDGDLGNLFSPLQAFFLEPDVAGWSLIITPMTTPALYCIPEANQRGLDRGSCSLRPQILAQIAQLNRIAVDAFAFQPSLVLCSTLT